MQQSTCSHLRTMEPEASGQGLSVCMQATCFLLRLPHRETYNNMHKLTEDCFWGGAGVRWTTYLCQDH